ncbi:MAG: hypothetical protein WC676_00900 [Candidatus Omnitrophota bacterium]
MKRAGEKSIFFILLAAAAIFSGCGGASVQLKGFYTPSAEADWIKDGQPIDFENGLWFPTDEVEVLTDSEMNKLGEYRGTEFFAEKIDVRPYNRLYTKFGRNKFRFFEKKDMH